MAFGFLDVITRNFLCNMALDEDFCDIHNSSLQFTRIYTTFPYKQSLH